MKCGETYGGNRDMGRPRNSGTRSEGPSLMERTWSRLDPKEETSGSRVGSRDEWRGPLGPGGVMACDCVRESGYRRWERSGARGGSRSSRKNLACCDPEVQASLMRRSRCASRVRRSGGRDCVRFESGVARLTNRVSRDLRGVRRRVEMDGIRVPREEGLIISPQLKY